MLRLKTNLHCHSCIEKITPYLSNHEQISKWHCDIQSPDKTLEVEGNISVLELQKLIKLAGYEAYTQAPSFWKDKRVWRRASFNTLNCLIGCSIGDFGMIIFLQMYYPNTIIIIQMILAIIAGLMSSILLETLILKIREKFSVIGAFKIAISMSFISMITMEIAMNITDFSITGGKANFGSYEYWFAFGIALVFGFLVPLPYNYYKLKKHNKSCH